MAPQVDGPAAIRRGYVRVIVGLGAGWITVGWSFCLHRCVPASVVCV